MELRRLAMSVPQTWESNFSSAFTSILPPSERVAVPGEASKVLWVGSDATLDRVLSAEWGRETFFLMCTEGSWLRLQQCLGDDDSDLIISITELMGFVFMALKQQLAWAGLVIAYAGDNVNVVGWLETMKSTNRFAKHLLRLLSFAMFRHKFVVLPFYLRTYHNHICE